MVVTPFAIILDMGVVIVLAISEYFLLVVPLPYTDYYYPAHLNYAQRNGIQINTCI